MKRALPFIAVAAVFGGFGVGCSGATTAFTRTGPTLPAQPDSCEFAIATTTPKEPATELGTIDIKYVKQTDWIYDEPVFRRKVRTLVCQSGGDTVVAHINDNGLYMNATVLTTKATPAPATPTPAAPPEPEVTADAPAPVASPATTAKAPAAAPDKSAQAAAKPEKKEASAKDDEPAKALDGKKRTKKGASAKKDDDIRGKDGKIDIDKLL
jgi:hypothetical protein